MKQKFKRCFPYTKFLEHVSLLFLASTPSKQSFFSNQKTRVIWVPGSVLQSISLFYQEPSNLIGKKIKPYSTRLWSILQFCHLGTFPINNPQKFSQLCLISKVVHGYSIWVRGFLDVSSTRTKFLAKRPGILKNHTPLKTNEYPLKSDHFSREYIWTNHRFWRENSLVFRGVCLFEVSLSNTWLGIVTACDLWYADMPPPSPQNKSLDVQLATIFLGRLV